MIDRIRIISMFKINDRKIFIVDHAWLKLFCDHTCDLFAVAKLLVGTRYSLTYTRPCIGPRATKQTTARGHKFALNLTSLSKKFIPSLLLHMSIHISRMRITITGRLHGTIVGPTGRPDPGHVRLVGQTSRTD